MPGPRQPIAYLIACSLAMGCAHGLVPFGPSEPAEPAEPAAPLAGEPPLLEDLAPEPLPPEPSPEEFADLLDRLRAGFALPVVDDPRVQREVDRYVANAAYLDRAFTRGRRYLHYIVQELEARDMPRELALLPVVESAFDPFARSPRRASGLWQFIPSTGRLYGLDQDWWLDGRRDVLAATRAALDHLEELHAAFDGDWFLALAAYNTGAGNVRRAISRNLRAGLPTDFFHLKLHRETRAYVPKLLAIAQVVAEPERFGIDVPAIPNEPYFTSVDAGGQIDLRKLANLAEIPFEELRALNPQYNRWATAPDGPHDLLVPASAEQRFQEALAALPPSERVRYAHHRVRRGDTLYEIAGRYGVPVAVLRALNRVRGNLIHPGQELLVPIPRGETSAEQPTRARQPGLTS